MKKIGIYLIIGGAVLFILSFIGSILTYLSNHPILWLGFLAILLGVAMIVYSVYQETDKN